MIELSCCNDDTGCEVLNSLKLEQIYGIPAFDLRQHCVNYYYIKI